MILLNQFVPMTKLLLHLLIIILTMFHNDWIKAMNLIVNRIFSGRVLFNAG